MTKSFDREPYLKHSNVAPDVTLSDYIARKQEEPPRITFEEFIKQYTKRDMEYHIRNKTTGLEFARACWNAALTKGKL